MKYILGIDLGTSSLKILLVDQLGQTIDVQQSDYEIISIKRGYSEQDPMSWIKAFDICFEKLIKKNRDLTQNIKSISFSGQMHSMVLLDKNNKPLRNAILWNDTRTSKECDYLNKNYKNELKNEAFNIALDGFTLPKLLWVKENEPEIFKQIDCLMLPKDFLVLYLTGIRQMELTDAAGTLMLDMNNNQWNKSFLEKLKINSNVLPVLNSPTKLVGSLTESIKNKFGILNTININIYSGAADNVCGAIGSGLIDESKALLSIGTSGVFVKLAKENKFEEKLHYFNYVDNMKYCMGVTLGAGISLKWFKEKILNSTLSYDQLIKNTDLTIHDPIFTPWLFGERTPYLDANIRGSFIGLDFNHTQQDVLKSILEGITYSLKTCLDIYETKANNTVKSIISIGGGANSAIWLQIQADIFNTEISTINNTQGPALGAAIIAAVGEGVYGSFKECINDWVKIVTTYKPIQKNVEIYKVLFEKYSKVYEALRNI